MFTSLRAELIFEDTELKECNGYVNDSVKGTPLFAIDNGKFVLPLDTMDKTEILLFPILVQNEVKNQCVDDNKITINRLNKLGEYGVCCGCVFSAVCKYLKPKSIRSVQSKIQKDFQCN